MESIEKLERVKKTLSDTAEVIVGLYRDTPFVNNRPSQQTEKLEKILKATTALQQELKTLVHKEEQDLVTSPFDAPLVNMIIHADFVIRSIASGKIKEFQFERDFKTRPPNYPTGLINDIEDFRASVAKALEMNKPATGNNAERNAGTLCMKYISRNFVRIYGGEFGRNPAMTKGGWAAQALDEVFERFQLGYDKGDYWLKVAVNESQEMSGQGRQARKKPPV